MNTYPHACSHPCCFTMVLIGIAWLLVSSGLLWLTWNKVVAQMAKVKPAKYWQALLVVATVCVFCAPRHYANRWNHERCGGGGCCHHHCEGGDSDGDGDDDGGKSDKLLKK